MSSGLFRRNDGRYVVRLYFGGRRIERTARTLREAEALREALLRQYHPGARPARVSLGEWVEEWLAQRGPDLRPSTLRTYRQTLGPVVEYIGHLRLDDVTPLALAKALAALRQAGMGQRRLQMAFDYLRACLNAAVGLGLLGGNPLSRVSRPRWEPGERQYWTPDEARRFISVALNSQRQHATLLVFLLGTGLRFSEAIALRWADVDLESGVVFIRRALVYAGRPSLQRPKSRSGERAVSLPGFVVEVLRRLPRPDSEEAPVFRNRAGRTPDPNSVRETLRNLCAEAGVPRINIHALRHTSATLLAAAGLDVKSLQRRLGHSSPLVTLGFYAHALSEGERRAAALLDQIFL